MAEGDWSKRHFEKIAELIKDSSESVDDSKRVNTIFCGDFAAYLETTNPRFDKEKFLNACEVDTEYTISELDAKHPESKIFDDEKKAIAFAKKENRQIYTQIDAGMDRVYLKGKHFVNRTGIYGVV